MTIVGLLLVALLAGWANLPAPSVPAGAPSAAIEAARCPADEPWTPAVVARALQVTERVVGRANRRFAVSNELLCTLPRADVEVVLARAAERKPGFDQPDKAIEYRIGALRGDDGTVAPDGPRTAYRQRQALVPKGELKRGGLSPGAPFWVGLGPGNVGGRVRSILPLSPTRIVVGSVSGGLWITEDAGASWAPARDLMPNVAISCLVGDPVDASIFYVCTGEGAYPYDAIQGDGVYRVTGANLAADAWTIAQVPGTAPTVASPQWYWVNRLVVLQNPADPANTANRVLLAATRNGLFRSADGGASFAKVASETDVGYTYGHRYMDLRVHPLDAANVVAGEMFTSGAGGGVAVSFDRGLTWTRRAIAGSERVEVAPVAGVAGRWLALAGHNGGQLFRSDDGGLTWIRQDVSGLDNATPSTGGVMGTQAWFDEALWASPDGSRVIAGGVDIRISLDAGVAFAKINSPTHVDHHAIVPATDNATTGTLYFGNDGGVYRATGVNTLATAPAANFFTSLNNGLAITQFYGGAGLGSFVTGGTQDNGTKSFNGTSWFGTFGGDGGRSAIDPTDARTVYGTAQNGALFRSTDGGVSASYICAGITEAGGCPGALSSGTLFVAPFTLDPGNPNRMLLGGQKLWRSTNVKAATPGWAVIREAQTAQSGGYNARISTIALPPGQPDVIWIGYEDGQVWRTGNGTAVAPTWERIVFNGVTNPTRQVLRIAFDPNDGNRAWIGLGGYNAGNVLFTGNAAAAAGAVGWADVHGNLPAAPVRTLVAHPQVPGLLYAGTEIGVFASDAGGTVWSTQNEGPGTVSVEDLFFTDPGTLIAATHGRGMFKASLDLPTAPGSIQFTRSALAVTEGDTATFTVTRVGGHYGPVTATYVAAGGTATSGVDYAATSGTLAWADGDTSSRELSIAIAHDNVQEGTETFALAISATTGASVGYPGTVVVSLFDPDAFPPGGTIPSGWVRPTSLATHPATPDATIVQGWIVDVDPARAHEGMLSMRSGDMTGQAFRKAAIEGVVTTGAGNVTFALRVPNSDCVRFYVDHVQAGSWCNHLIALKDGILQAIYDVVSIPVAAGTHTFRWSFDRSGGAEPILNGGWVDAVSFPPTGLEPAFTSAAMANFTVGSAGSFTVAAAGSPPPSLVLAGTLPAGLDFHAATGVLDGTPASGSAGSRTVALTAANGRYPDATQYLTIAVARATQAISFAAVADVSYGTAPFALSATASSGLPVAFGSLTPGVCGVAGGSLSVVGAGTCTVTADQAGDADYLAAPQVGQSFTVTAATQSIAFGAPPLVAVGGTGSVTATSTSGLAVTLTTATPLVCSLSGNTVVGLGAGICSIAADQPGNGNFAPAPQVLQSFTIGDGWWDVFWRRADGTNAIWQFTGPGPADFAAAFPPGVPANWQARGVGDVNGDGTPDVVWFQPSIGLVAIWLMGSNGAVTAATYPAAVGAGSPWTIAAVGDVDGDGRADIVWRHGITGEVLVWNMSTSGTIGRTTSLGTVPLAYEIRGVGDFNGDGTGDLLWIHPADGVVVVYLMHADGTFAAAFPGAVGPGNWRPHRIGDFDGDGNADVFWRNEANGMTAAWYMHGGSVAASDFFVSVPFAAWQLGSAGDFDLDGRTDLLWYAPGSGYVVLWQMQARHVAPITRVLPAVGPGWQMVP